MTQTSRELLGGSSLYAVNVSGVQRAHDLLENDPASGPRLRAHLERLEAELDSMERAAMALVVIDRVLRDQGG